MNHDEKREKDGNRAEAYKTDEQRYSEEQDAIDRETKKKLREMEQEEKMQKLPSTAPEEIKTIRVSQDKFEEYTGEYRKPYMITKDDGFKVGNVVKLVVFVAGKATGERLQICSRFFLACLPSCYMRVSVHSNVHNCPPLVDNRTGEPMKRGERRCF